MIQEMEKQQLTECSFQPQINKKKQYEAITSQY